jgi:hypothetical protein
MHVSWSFPLSGVEPDSFFKESGSSSSRAPFCRRAEGLLSDCGAHRGCVKHGARFAAARSRPALTSVSASPGTEAEAAESPLVRRRRRCHRPERPPVLLGLGVRACRSLGGCVTSTACGGPPVQPAEYGGRRSAPRSSRIQETFFDQRRALARTQGALSRDSDRLVETDRPHQRAFASVSRRRASRSLTHRRQVSVGVVPGRSVPGSLRRTGRATR